MAEMEDPVKAAKLNILFPNKKPKTVDPPEIKQELYQYISTRICDGTHTDESTFMSYIIMDINPVIQCGLPVCGMVALTMAYQLLTRSTQICPSAEPLNLLESAQVHGYSKQGEMLSCNSMLLLSTKNLNSEGMIMDINDLTLELLLRSLYRHDAILVPYDCDKDHTPFLAQGHEAHWCLIVGVMITSLNNLKSYCVIDSQCGNHYELFLKDESLIDEIIHKQFRNVLVVTRHGKSRHLGFWPLKQLQDSNSNLAELNPSRNPNTLIVPPDGLVGGLQSKAVSMWGSHDQLEKTLFHKLFHLPL